MVNGVNGPIGLNVVILVIVVFNSKKENAIAHRNLQLILLFNNFN